MHHKKHMSRDHHPSLHDVTADMEKTAYPIVACWIVFVELLPGNALIKSDKILFCVSEFLKLFRPVSVLRFTCLLK
jgi:hypothetical protein